MSDTQPHLMPTFVNGVKRKFTYMPRLTSYSGRAQIQVSEAECGGQPALWLRITEATDRGDMSIFLTPDAATNLAEQIEWLVRNHLAASIITAES